MPGTSEWLAGGCPTLEAAEELLKKYQPTSKKLGFEKMEDHMSPSAAAASTVDLEPAVVPPPPFPFPSPLPFSPSYNPPTKKLYGSNFEVPQGAVH